jgi:hypothetical protein
VAAVRVAVAAGVVAQQERHLEEGEADGFCGSR